jgi:hypothetical protein
MKIKNNKLINKKENKYNNDLYVYEVIIII